jgi:transposase
VRERPGHSQRIQKTLEDANIKLDSVISDIVGISGRRMIEALIAGRTDPQALAELAASLRGRVTAHHRFMLRLHLDQLDALDAAIGRMDKEVDCSVEPFRVAIEMLKTIPGVSRLSAPVIVSEIGIDMSRFPAEGDMISWAGLCPKNDESAGKRRSTRMKKGAPWLKTTLVQCAWAATRTKDTYLHAQYLPHSIPPRRQEGHRCCRRFHPQCRLPHAQKWHPLPGPRRKPLRQTRPRQARLATREPLKEPRFRRSRSRAMAA